MALSTQPYKGARDFYPEDMRIQRYMFDVLSRTCESFGYEKIDAPILEPTDLYLSKGNTEIVNEQTYTFDDRGGRSVTIRTEMTPSVSRMVAARRQELAYPVRWYCTPNFWRYERMQRGRLREFWQPNVDIFGVEGIEADFEIIQIADQILKNFGAKPDMYQIKLNSRKLINAMMNEYLELSEVQASTLIKLIDRMHKMERMKFIAEAEAIFSPGQREDGLVYRLIDLLQVKKFDNLPDQLKNNPAMYDLRVLVGMLQAAGVTNAVFDITLMRGFEYYTDIVFEVFDTDPENSRSLFGGGRYSGMMSLFGVEPITAVGFGMGDVTLRNFLTSHNLLPELRTETDLYVILIGDVFDKSQKLFASLRKMGLNIAVDTTKRKMDKQIKTAVKKSIRFVLFVGEAELADGTYKLRDLQTGTEESHGPERIVSIVKRKAQDEDDL